VRLAVRGFASILAFVAKEILEVIRSPAALVSLTLGPVLIMVLFGIGFSGYSSPLRTVIVIPPDSGLSTEVSQYADAVPGIDVVDVVPDRAPAEERLRLRQIDAVIVAPASLQSRFLDGKQSVVDVLINVSDPIANVNASYVVSSLSAELNRRILEEVARQGIAEAVKAGSPAAWDIPPQVIAAPTRADLKNIAPVEPSVVAYYGAAVLAFILQHIAVSLIALSLVRERTRGSFELFRFAPVSAVEVVVGKVLACVLITAVVAVAMTLLLVRVLGVPMLGDPLQLGLTLALVAAASLGLGVIIAVVSNTERQVVQLALLVLLASVFFSGLFLSLDLFRPLARPFMYLLPATHGIALTQDLMLYGWTNATWHFGVLAVMAVFLLVGGSLLLRRQLERA
jgi:ABC-type multidrug transport system permease subunit